MVTGEVRHGLGIAWVITREKKTEVRLTNKCFVRLGELDCLKF